MNRYPVENTVINGLNMIYVKKAAWREWQERKAGMMRVTAKKCFRSKGAKARWFLHQRNKRAF
ncbi:hypothetical protein [Kushneria marisflavi]|uniref:hypothetical protein n=1 Tax=Kushneria marisflavi TaxID=157779 RepID=UPI0012FB563A|nr:hypothetical protein [Kushneria marisflavi]